MKTGQGEIPGVRLAYIAHEPSFATEHRAEEKSLFQATGRKIVLDRRSIIVGLAVANLLLFGALLLATSSPSQALAQRPGASGAAFSSVTAKVAGKSYDVLYILDAQKGRLHALYATSKRPTQLSYAGSRDLRIDFDRK